MCIHEIQKSQLPRQQFSEERTIMARYAASIGFAHYRAMGALHNRKALIYDEAGFSRVCSALLEISGCTADIMGEHRDASHGLNNADVGVFITSYPYGAFMLDEVKKRSIPAIVLYDNLDESFIDFLNAYDNLYCMIKPLDYDKFKGLVLKLLSGAAVSRDDYTSA